MSQGNKSNAVLYIIIGAVGLFGLCCVGVGGMAYWGYVQAEAAQEEIAREMQRAEEQARRMEEQARRAEEEAIREHERMLAQDRFAEEVAGTPVDAPPPLSIAPTATADRRPRHIVARVTRAEGSAGVSVGDRCDYDVTVEDSSSRPAGYWCRAFVECNGVRLYGTDTPRRNGFFPCEIFADPMGVAGEDRETTQGVGDPFFQIDTRRDRMVVIDDATSMVGGPYHIEARVLRVR